MITKATFQVKFGMRIENGNIWVPHCSFLVAFVKFA